eukprot:TRINITY_DN25778_c0_g1_i1.p1 TRINITY_DN25778_c0_g1~~TRINITY_DN25778_c0_g1_i1.p1  ORF type:complete len:480 (-),score=102.26 TRINITY_DN25778_c0_g1_i1:54-1457(-)
MARACLLGLAVSLCIAFNDFEQDKGDRLPADDECASEPGAADCSLNALQRKALRRRADLSHSLEMESFGENPSDEVLWSKYQDFLAFWSREYGPAEQKQRFKLFKNSFRRAKRYNQGSSGSGVFGINGFADFKFNERPTRGLKLPNDRAYIDSGDDMEDVLGSSGDEGEIAADPKPEPADIDWRETKAVSPVKNQGVCGACWAFVTAEEIESMFVLWQNGGGSGASEVFSVQQLISCAPQADGCGGGNPINGYNYVSDSKSGLVQEEFWPYEGGLLPSQNCQEQWCTKPCNRNLSDTITYEHIIGPRAAVLGGLWATPLCSPGSECSSQNLENMRRVLVELGPIGVAVNSRVWYDYKRGVLSEDACEGSAWGDLDHAAQLTGYNTSADMPYWIVRNQWTTNWGMNGYIWLEYGKNTCGIANMASVPRLKGMPTKKELVEDISILQMSSKPDSFRRMYMQAIGKDPSD